MTKSRITLLLFTVLFMAEALAACDLRLTIRPHADRVVFGDPLYVEVEIVNRGEQPVFGPPPSLWLATLVFRICDYDRRLSYTYTIGGAGGGEPVRFEPGRPVKYYCYFFFPHYRWFDHPFWKLYRDGGLVSVGATYGFRPGVPLTSRLHDVSIVPRRESEIVALRYWTSAEFEPWVKGFQPGDFGIHFRSSLNVEQMHRLALDVRSGELGDLFDLSAQFRELYELAPEARQAAERALIERLQQEPTRNAHGYPYHYIPPEGGIERVRYYPDVKRQVLARELHNLAGGYNMRSTARAIEKAFPGIKPFTGVEKE